MKFLYLTLYLVAATQVEATSKDPLIRASILPTVQTAVIFVGHGEPETMADWSEHHTFSDGSSLGPSGATLGVPVAEQDTIQAAAYEEIATAMSYQYRDLNQNGISHELALVPNGDVPAYFTFMAFKDMVAREMKLLGEGPHNRLIFDHVKSIKASFFAKDIDMYWALLDASPLLQQTVATIGLKGQYRHLVIVPLFLAPGSTHTQEIEELVHAALKRSHLAMDVSWASTFYPAAYVKQLHMKAVISQVNTLRHLLPEGTDNKNIGVVLAGHGDPFVLPYPEFGYKKGDIHSDLTVTEDAFAKELMEQIPFETRFGVNEFRRPSMTTAIDSLKAIGKKQILVVPMVFPTACYHAMWDMAHKALGRFLPAASPFGVRRDADGSAVWYSSAGYADSGEGAVLFRQGMEFVLLQAMIEVAFKHPSDFPEAAAALHIPPGLK